MWRWIVFTGAGRRVDVIFVLKTEIQQRQNNSVPLNVTSLFLKLARTSRRTARPQKIHNGKNYTSYHGGRRFSCVAVIKPTAVSCVNRVPFFISLFYFFFFFYNLGEGIARTLSRWCENEHASKTPANDHSTTEGVARIIPFGRPSAPALCALFYPHRRRQRRRRITRCRSSRKTRRFVRKKK